MGSISKESSGGYRLTYIDGNSKKQQCIRLGKVNLKAAKAVLVKVDQLIGYKITKTPMDTETAKWVADIADDLAEKLATKGLIPHRQKSIDLRELLSMYAKEIESKNKLGTQTNHRTITNDLLGYFKVVEILKQISVEDAEGFKQHLLDRGLATATVARRIKRTRSIFAYGVKKKYLDINPFAEVVCQSTLPKESRVYVPVADVETVMRHANPTWRTILALARFAGLRCPSEVLSLRWEHVNLADEMMTVSSPKTEHHPGKDYRTVPIFGNLKPYLEEAYELAEDGEEYVVGGPQGKRYRESAQGPNGWVSCNLRTPLQKLIRRAGLKPWPKSFNNLRASAEFDLSVEFPMNIVVEWIGHSTAVALKHYSRVPDHVLQQAKEFGKPVTESVTVASQNASQSGADKNVLETTNATETPVNKGFCRVVSHQDRLSPDDLMTPRGFEPRSIP